MHLRIYYGKHVLEIYLRIYWSKHILLALANAKKLLKYLTKKF